MKYRTESIPRFRTALKCLISPIQVNDSSNTSLSNNMKSPGSLPKIDNSRLLKRRESESQSSKFIEYFLCNIKFAREVYG